MTLKAQCPGCERKGKAMAYCEYCEEWIPLTLALPAEERDYAAPGEGEKK